MSEKIYSEELTNTTSQDSLENERPLHSLRDESVVETIKNDVLSGEFLPDELELNDISPKVIGAVLKEVSVSMSSGPLPNPDKLKEYELIQPGAADRILKLAENEQAHRFAMDDKLSSVDSRDSLLGILTAATLSLTGIITGAIIAVFVDNTGGLILSGVFGLSGISPIVVSLIRNTTTSWKNKKNSDTEKE